MENGRWNARCCHFDKVSNKPLCYEPIALTKTMNTAQMRRPTPNQPTPIANTQKNQSHYHALSTQQTTMSETSIHTHETSKHDMDGWMDAWMDGWIDAMMHATHNETQKHVMDAWMDGTQNESATHCQ